VGGMVPDTRPAPSGRLEMRQGSHSTCETTTRRRVAAVADQLTSAPTMSILATGKSVVARPWPGPSQVARESAAFRS
jgi:hypothetical protein